MQQKSPTPQGPAKSGVRKVRIDADTAGQRIDNFLRRELPGVPRSRLYRLLRRGEVRVNGGRIRPTYRLKAGDEVRVPPARLRMPGAAPQDRIAAKILDRVIYEDRTILVIDKPAGLAVHGGSGISHGAIELLRHARPDIRDLALVHRLDRETSGCLVIAKRRSALRALHEKFRNAEVAKNYLALIVGDWQLGDTVIDAPLSVRHRRGGERHVVVSASGKAAATRVRLSRRFSRYSLVCCEPQTGRTHQIRVHLNHVGFPILGDSRYGNTAENRRAREIGLHRLFLHAQSIGFPDARGNELHVSAPLPDELQLFIDRLETDS